MEYNKLVRDNIPSSIEAKGEKVYTHIADDQEYEQALYKKLIEEAREFKAKPSAEEMADLQEVLTALAEFKKISAEEVTKAKLDKAEKKGGFSKRIILERTEIV